MASSQHKTITQLLEELQAGHPSAFDAIFKQVYSELRRNAHQQRRWWRGHHSLNTTALVHEAYMKLVDQRRARWSSRAHFLAVAAKAMRHILINYARRRRAQKRGGSHPKLSLDEVKDALGDELALTEERAEALIILDEALERLAEKDQRQSQVVECRFFGGMTIPETAAALGVSPATVSRDWSMAQAWLYREMKKVMDT